MQDSKGPMRDLLCETSYGAVTPLPPLYNITIRSPAGSEQNTFLTFKPDMTMMREHSDNAPLKSK